MCPQLRRWFFFFQRLQRFFQNIQNDEQTLPAFVAQYRRILQSKTALFKRDQAGRQVTAIHRGNVAGQKRCQRL